MRIVVDFEVIVSIRSHHRYLGSLGIEEKNYKNGFHAFLVSEGEQIKIWRVFRMTLNFLNVFGITTAL